MVKQTKIVVHSNGMCIWRSQRKGFVFLPKNAIPALMQGGARITLMVCFISKDSGVFGE